MRRYEQKALTDGLKYFRPQCTTMSEQTISRRCILRLAPLPLLCGCSDNSTSKILLKKIELRNYRNSTQQFHIKISDKQNKILSKKTSLSSPGKKLATSTSISGEWTQTARAYKITVKTKKQSERITASHLSEILDKDSYSGAPCLDLTFSAERSGDLGVAFGDESNCKDPTDAQ